LSHWRLLGLAPQGGSIPYDPAMPRQAREMAVRQWTTLVPPGQLPSSGKAAPKKEKDKS
jgi:hypothetical protein